MVIVFGTNFYGKVAQVNKQWVETKFFSIMFIPIFPVSSMFVTKSEFRRRAGFNIDMNRTSILAVYGRMFSFILAVLFLFFWLYGSGWFAAVIGLLFVAAWVYLTFYYGKASESDILLRNKVGSITGLYALPHWFDYGQLQTFLDRLQNHYKHSHPDSDWKQELFEDNIEPQKQSLLYGLALFNYMTNSASENVKLYEVADSFYNPTVVDEKIHAFD